MNHFQKAVTDIEEKEVIQVNGAADEPVGMVHKGEFVLRREMRKQKGTLQRVQLHVDGSDQELIRRVEQRRLQGVRWA